MQQRLEGLKGQPQALLQADLGAPVQLALGPRRGDRDPLHLADAGGRKIWLKVLGFAKCTEQRDQLEDA